MRMRLPQSAQKGFTLVELLVTIGIIGILATATVVSIGSARAKARDARRLQDVKAIQTALTLYQGDKVLYPDSGVVKFTLGTRPGAYSVFCDSAAGFQTNKDTCQTFYLDPIPGDPLSKEGSAYEYYYASGQNLQTYTLEFNLESNSGGLAKGAHSATPAGIQ